MDEKQFIDLMKAELEKNLPSDYSVTSGEGARYTKFQLGVSGTAIDGTTNQIDTVSISTWGTVTAESNSGWGLTIRDTNPFTDGHFGGTWHASDSSHVLVSMDFFSSGTGTMMPSAHLIWVDISDGTNHLFLMGMLGKGTNGNYPITVFSFSFTTPWPKTFYWIYASGTITLS